MTPEQPWTLADRYRMAHEMAKNGASREDIMYAARLTEFTATCIVNKHRPGTHDTLSKSRLED
jgi:hypothetical protein